MIVSDSNLIAYLFLPSPNSTLAEQVLQKESKWIAPLLWRSEFRNILTLYMRHQAITVYEAQQTMERAESFMVENEFFVPSDPVLELTSTTMLSAYDAEFVILARQLQTKLVTSDKGVLAADPNNTVSPEKFVH